MMWLVVKLKLWSVHEGEASIGLSLLTTVVTGLSNTLIKEAVMATTRPEGPDTIPIAFPVGP